MFCFPNEGRREICPFVGIGHAYICTKDKTREFAGVYILNQYLKLTFCIKMFLANSGTSPLFLVSVKLPVKFLNTISV